MGVDKDIGVEPAKHGSHVAAPENSGNGLVVDFATIRPAGHGAVANQDRNVTERHPSLQMFPAILGHCIANQLSDGTALRSGRMPEALVV